MHITFLCLTLLSVFLGISSVDVSQHWNQPYTVACMDEINFDQSILPDIMDENFYITSTDPSVYVLFECIFKTLKMIQDGKFVREEVINYVAKGPVPFFKPNAQEDPVKIAEDTYEICKNVEGGTLGEQAISIRDCIIREIRKHK